MKGALVAPSYNSKSEWLHIKKELFAELMGSMGEALEHARGKRELRTTVLPAAPAAMSSDDIRALRDRLNASQAVFARFLNVSTQLVQAWEADRRRPEGAALRPLEVGRREPSVVFVGLTANEAPRPAGRVRESSEKPRARTVATPRRK